MIKVEEETDQYLLVTNSGVIIRANAATVSNVNRNTKGVRLINLDDNTKVVSLARYAAGEEEEDETEGVDASSEEAQGSVEGDAEQVGADGDDQE